MKPQATPDMLEWFDILINDNDYDMSGWATTLDYAKSNLEMAPANVDRTLFAEIYNAYGGDESLASLFSDNQTEITEQPNTPTDK